MLTKVILTCLLLQPGGSPANLGNAVPLDPSWEARRTPRYHRLMAGESSGARHLNDAPDIHLMYMRDTGIPVTEGLQAGEWIATAGVSFLKEGQKVRIVEPEGS